MPVIVTDDRQPRCETEIRPESTLVSPLRLSMPQTERALRAAPPPPGERPARPAQHGISVELLNVQSILPKLPDIRAEHQQDGGADILCFTETHIRTGTPDHLVSLPGYKVYRRDRLVGRKKSGGGVAIYVREDMQVNRLSLTTRAGSSSHVESLWVKVKVSKRRSVTVCLIYRPPSTSTSQINNDYDDIANQLQVAIAAESAQNLILLGDLNSDSNTNPAAHKRLQELEKYGINNQVTVPTFHRGDTHSVLDVVLISNELCGEDVTSSCIVQCSAQ